MPKFSPSRPFMLRPNPSVGTKDSTFVGNLVAENFRQGSPGIYCWMYVGNFPQENEVGGPNTAIAEGDVDIGVQDVVLGENRDRRYADNPVLLRGAYRISQNALDFARFGVMLSADRIQVEFSREEHERLLGRRIAVGDVLEMPHMADVTATGMPRNRWYAVDDVARTPTGFDAAWESHIVTATCEPIRDAQEFIDLMERETKYGRTLGDELSDRKAMTDMSSVIAAAAEEQSPTTWFDLRPIWVDGEAETVMRWFDDAVPPNGLPAAMASSFPGSPTDGDYVVRVDFLPNRLYRYQDGHWVLKEVDRKRAWGSYNWTAKLRSFSSDGSPVDEARPWELRSIHDITTARDARSKPSPSDDPLLPDLED